MATAVMTSKGQITIPVEVRQKLGVEAGDRVEFVEVDNGKFELIAAVEHVQSLKGIVRRPSKPVSVEAMNKAIARRRAGRR
jgi:AbrB family looped-hinge helix DNA binding protein